MRTVLGFTSITFIAAILWGTINLGVFKSVAFHTASAGPHYVIGKNHTGPYHEISPVLTEVESWTRAQGFACQTTFGFYLDDPNVVEILRLRSKGGCLLTEEEWIKQASRELPEGYFREVFPQQNYLIAKFAGSPWLGPYKVYGKAEELIYQSTQRLGVFPVIELYDTDGKTIETTYLFN